MSQLVCFDSISPNFLTTKPTKAASNSQQLKHFGLPLRTLKIVFSMNYISKFPGETWCRLSTGLAILHWDPPLCKKADYAPVHSCGYLPRPSQRKPVVSYSLRLTRITQIAGPVRSQLLRLVVTILRYRISFSLCFSPFPAFSSMDNDYMGWTGIGLVSENESTRLSTNLEYEPT